MRCSCFSRFSHQIKAFSFNWNTTIFVFEEEEYSLSVKHLFIPSNHASARSPTRPLENYGGLIFCSSLEISSYDLLYSEFFGSAELVSKGWGCSSLVLAIVDPFNVSNKASNECIITVNSDAGAIDVDDGLTGGDDGGGDDDNGGVNDSDVAWSRRRCWYVLTIIVFPVYIINLWKFEIYFQI